MNGENFARNFTAVHKKEPKATMNIFGSKSGHLNISKNCKIFFILPQFLLYYLMIFPSSAESSNTCCKHFGKNEEKSINNSII